MIYIRESILEERFRMRTGTTHPTRVLQSIWTPYLYFKNSHQTIFQTKFMSKRDHTTMSVSEAKLPAIISPSLLSCDLATLSDEADDMHKLGADWLHMDVMDGHFVPNLSFGPPVINSLHKAQSKAFLDCHLMVTKPMTWVEPMAKAGCSLFTFHIESDMPEGGPMELIETIKNAGMKVGVSLKPGTPADAIYEYADKGLFDLILVMTVEPGFSGQSFKPEMMPKVETLRKKYPRVNIQVDGGLSPKTVDQASKAGANVIVAASAIFGSDDKGGVIKSLRESVESQGVSKQ